MGTSLELTIGITACNEDEDIVYRTIMSVFRALAKVGVSYELILHVDGDNNTLSSYLEETYRHQKKIRIVKNGFSDVGKSRNYITSIANGQYVLFIDADDIISVNYISSILKTLRNAKNEDVVVHPEASLTFGETSEAPVLWKMRPSLSRKIDAFILFSRNRWIASLAARRDLLLQYPYLSTSNGYGHEDYILNLRLSEGGIRHLIAPNTIYFYRQKSDSMLNKNNAEHVTQPYSELFDINQWKTYDFSSNASAFSKKRSSITDMLFQKIVLPKLWKKASQIEPLLIRTLNNRSQTIYYDTESYNYASEAYQNLCKQILSNVCYIIIADMHPLDENAIRKLLKRNNQRNVAILNMSEQRNVMILPKRACCIEFGNAASALCNVDRDILLTRLLIQLRVKDLCIFANSKGKAWLEMHNELSKHLFNVELVQPEANVS